MRVPTKRLPKEMRILVYGIQSKTWQKDKIRVGRFVICYGREWGGGLDNAASCHSVGYIKLRGVFGKTIHKYYDRGFVETKIDWVNINLLARYKQELETVLAQLDDIYQRRDLQKSARKKANAERLEQTVAQFFGKE